MSPSLDPFNEFEIDRLAHNLASSFGRASFYEYLKGLDLSEEICYRIQRKYVAQRLPETAAVKGYKIGCTSPTVQSDLGINSPIYGSLTSDLMWHQEYSLHLDDIDHLAIEGELAVTIGRGLNHETEPDDIWSHIESLYPVVELHHVPADQSLLRLQDIIASNGMHAGVVLGKGIEAHRETVSNLGMQLSIQGLADIEITNAELMNSTRESILWLTKKLTEEGLGLQAGEIVLCGTIAPLFPINQATEVVVKLGQESEVRCSIESNSN